MVPVHGQHSSGPRLSTLLQKRSTTSPYNDLKSGVARRHAIQCVLHRPRATAGFSQPSRDQVLMTENSTSNGGRPVSATERDDDITEITHLEATKVAGVESPANRAPFILLKRASDAKPEPTSRDFDGDGEAGDDDAATADAFEENAKRVKQGKEPAKKEDGDASKSDSSEADEIEEQMTGSAAKGLDEGAYCGDPECSACQKAGALPDRMRRLNAMAKAKLKAADRKKMPAGSFAYVDPKGGKHLPIHDKDHVSAAMGRFGQQDFSDADDPADAKQKAAGKIKAAAGKFGMKVDDGSDVAQAAKKEEARSEER